MVEIKQLKYFVVSADMGSFTAAARILYTTQTNVSKTISALETRLGFSLFERETRGIRLTVRGKKFYQKANVLINDVEELEKEITGGHSDTVSISANPGSWFADMFSKFYDRREFGLCQFRVHVDNTENILQRVRNGEDEIGFICVFPDYMEQFDYDLERHHLAFEVLRRMDGMLYFNPEKTEWQEPVSSAPDALRLVQMTRDEFSLRNDWKMADDGNRQFVMPEVSVVTNSDDIMNVMLKKTGMANISVETFFDYGPEKCPGIRLVRDEGKILYGVLTNKNNKPGKIAEEFAAFMRGRLLYGVSL